MEENSSVKRFWAGLFFIGGVVMVSLCILVIGFDRGLTQPKFQVIALFNQVGGLIEGAPIRISGVNVGIVGSVDFLDQPIEGRSLKVTMSIFKKYELHFLKCSRVSIKTEGVLGQKLVEISEEGSHRVFDMTKPIIGEDPLDVENIAGVITRTAISLQETSQDLSEVLVQWKSISRKTNRLINRVEEKIVEGPLFKIF